MLRLWLSASIVLALLAPATALANPGISEFSTAVGARPLGIAPGPDGALWFTEADGQAIGRITVTGSMTEFPLNKPSRQPTGIVGGPDGNLWFTEPGNAGAMGKIGKMTTAGALVKETDTGGSSAPTGITAGPDGALWFTEQGANKIGRITTAASITDVWPTDGTGPTSIALGPDGNLWFTEAGTGTIGRITPGGVVDSFPLPTANSNPSGIVAGPDGALWFAEQAVNQIARITTDGAVTEYPAGSEAMGPEAVAVGADGNVWFAKATNPGAFGRIDASGGHENWLMPTSGVFAKGIAAGPDGNLWLTSSTQDKVMRVIPGPGVETAAASDTSTTSATLRGVVRPASKPTAFYFEYGTTTGYGATTQAGDAGSGTAPVSAATTVSDLAPQTTYHYRLVAANSSDASRGPDRTFTTGAAPPNPLAPPTLDQAPTTTAPPTPVLGRSVVVGAAQGVVKVKFTGTSTFVPLTDNVSVATGSELDTTKGAVKLVSALDTRGHVQTGTFSRGRFKVKQSKTGRGMTDLYLSGPKPGPCSAPKRASASKLAKRRTRSLWGKDNKGRFRTHGADSVATVRGTRWLTEDRCDGTLTRVTQGEVVVREVHRERTKVVRAGQSYLARRK
jgi:virginiamycin B lyase